MGPTSSQSDDELGFDFIIAKLLRPPVRSGTVQRRMLLEQLTRPGIGPVVSVVAPAGFGKTTLLAQWADADDRPFAWVSIDEEDDDPKVLLSYIAEALNRVEPINERVFDALGSSTSSIHGTVVPRLGAALASITRPVVVVLDDVHRLSDATGRAAISVLADHVPEGSLIVFAGRSAPPPRIARLRADGRLLEIGSDDLALTREQAAQLLRSEIVIGDVDVDELYRRTEGWPVGLYLAALYLRAGGSSHNTPDHFGGDDRFVSDYVESEFLTRIARAERSFLTRTAVLDEMYGPLCDAVLETQDAAAELALLAESNLLLVPLDRRGEWFRYHHLFRDLLRAELERTEPGLIPILQRRAATWYLDRDAPETAMEYLIAAGDDDAVARLLKELWSPVYRQGRIATLQRWFEWLESRGEIDHHPMSAINAAFLALTTGQTAKAERWSETVENWWRDRSEPNLDAYTAAMAATLKAMTCRRGVDRMREDADEAARLFAIADFVPAITPLLQGASRSLAGNWESADDFFADAELREGELQSVDILAITKVERALGAIARGDWPSAGELANRARSELRAAGVEDSYAVPLVMAVHARIALYRADVHTARAEALTALRLRHLLTFAYPHLALQCRLMLVRVLIALDDVAAARTVMDEVDEIRRHRPQMGTLTEEAEELHRRLDTVRGSIAGGATALTAAELRILPLLMTHLTYAEIAAELFLSKNTVKTQAYSLFRKLGVRSRTEAIARSIQLAILEA